MMTRVSVKSVPHVSSPPGSGVVLPNTIICGAMKSGTTTLFSFFSDHPDALTSTHKEVHFFDRDPFYERGVEYYASFFPGYEGQRAVVEATPNYLIIPEVPHRIADTVPDARLIFIFRNPVDRAYSHFWQCYRNGWPWSSIEDALDDPRTRFLVAMGRYGALLKRYLDVIPREQMLLLRTDDLKQDSSAVRRRCYEHAGIDPAFVPPTSSHELRSPATFARSRLIQRLAYRFLLPGMRPEVRLQYDEDGLVASEVLPSRGPFQRIQFKAYRLVRWLNEYKRRYPPMSRETRSRLTALFREDLKRFAELSGLDVSPWLSSG